MAEAAHLKCAKCGFESHRSYVEKVIIANKAKCLICNEVVESKTTHDFRSCLCGSLYVDGGTDYVKRLYRNPADYEELTEYEGD